MIITCVSHGRRADDARNLAAHLTKTRGQIVSVATLSGLTPGLTLTMALADLRRMTAMSKKASIGFHHITINPAREWTLEQRDQAISRVLGELGAGSHAWLLVEHGEKARAVPSGANRHWHLVLAHVGPEGRALDMAASYARLEAVARTCEHDFAEPLTPTRHPTAVARHLSRIGREDVRQALLKIQPEQLPRSAMSSAGRQRAARSDVNLPAIRAIIRSAWTTPDLGEALAPHGFRLAHGKRPGVIVLKTADGAIAGALDRLAGVSREEARRRVEAEMARQRKTKEDAHDGLQHRQRARSRVARQDSAAARTGNAGGSRNDPVTARPERRVASPRLLGEDRSETRHPFDDPAAGRRRRLRALIELRQAEAAAKRRRQHGRTSEADVQAAKAALAVKLFGRALSAETIAALHYVDLAARLATLRGGGWVRDAGDRLYASGADPAVIRLMVDAAKAKGWQSIMLFGSQAFIEEATRQCEAAGIPVVQKDEPPATTAAAAAKKSESAETFFRDRLAAAELRLAKIRKPPAPAPLLARAERAEAEADDARWAARPPHDEALEKRNAAQRELEKAGLLGRAKAKRALADAEAEYLKAKETYAAACEAHESAKWRADCERRRQKDWEKRHREKMADDEREIEAEREFAAACLATMEADAKLTSAGVDAIEAATRQRSAEKEAEPAELEDDAAGRGWRAPQPRMG